MKASLFDLALVLSTATILCTTTGLGLARAQEGGQELPQPKFIGEETQDNQRGRPQERMPWGQRFRSRSDDGSQANGPGAAHKAGWFKDLLEELELSPAQREKLRALRQDKGEKREQMQALFEQRKAFKQMLFAPESSEAEIRASLKSMQSQALKQSEQKVERMLELRKILTPDQLSVLGTRMQEKRTEMRAGKGFGQRSFGAGPGSKGHDLGGKHQGRKGAQQQADQAGRGPGKKGPPSEQAPGPDGEEMGEMDLLADF
jgi:Spy/CpxP family protein refolding chaperone